MLWNSFFAFHYNSISEVKVLFAQLCQNLWEPLDCSSPGSSVHGIFQAKMLEWIVIFFSRRSSWPRDLTPVSCITGGFFTIFAVELHGTVVKNPLAKQRWEFDPCVGKISWRRKWQPTPVFLPGESHGHRSLVDYSPWGRKESYITERLNNNSRLNLHQTARNISS